jgi:hypothetical protein
VDKAKVETVEQLPPPMDVTSLRSFLGHAGVGAKNALNAKHTASRTKLASHVQRAKDVPVNFS